MQQLKPIKVYCLVRDLTQFSKILNIFAIFYNKYIASEQSETDQMKIKMKPHLTGRI